MVFLTGLVLFAFGLFGHVMVRPNSSPLHWDWRDGLTTVPLFIGGTLMALSIAVGVVRALIAFMI